MVVGEASIHNIMGGMESTGGVRLHNHKRKLKQRFDIIKKLGQGTYGKVQLGINKETGQEVAIKTIKKCKIETEADLIRIRREIQIMSSVQHPNIIHIYEVFENREKMVLVMEYAAGGELYDYLSERKVLPEHEARRIFRQIATAVFYCHKHKICHRDLKLENILLDQIGNAKIADFGLSNVFDERRLLSTFCGSPLYASPEIVKGTPYHGPEVDCWSLGVLLFTLVYGAMPFDGSNFKRLVKQISQSDYFEPKKPSPASPLIKDMLTVCPTRRADVEKICAHWWVNEGYEQSCLDIAEELAAQTPVRLDLLLSLVPQSASAEKLVVGDQQAAGDTAGNMSSETLVPTRCHSVGSLMELDQNNSDRRIRELVEEDPRNGAAGDAKRKLETTPSMDETAAAGVKRKERSRRKDRTAADRETRQYRSGSRHHSAPIPNPITEEAMEVDPSVVVTVPTSKTIDINLLEGAAACSELIEESKEKALRDERSKTPVIMPSPSASTAESQSQEAGQIVPENELVEREVLDDRKEETSELKTGESTKKIEHTPGKKKTVKAPKTSENSSEIVQNETEVSKKAAEELTAAEAKNEESCTTETLKTASKPDEGQSDKKPLRKLKEKAISLDSDAGNEVAEPPMKPVERRRSKIFETAEKFNQLAAAAESDKPKKIFIPGVNVGGAKRAFERKASLSSVTIPQTVKPSASKVIIDVPAAAKAENVQEKTEISTEENNGRIEKALSKREEEKKRAVDIISGAIGKPPMMKKLNGSPPTSPQNHSANKLGLKLQVGPNDVRNATVSVSTPTETKFPFENKQSLQPEVVPDTLEAANTSTFVSDEPKKSSKMEITLKSATLPRPRKTSKAEITLAGVKAADSPAFKSEVEAKIDAFHPQKLRTQRSEVAFPVAAAVPQANRSSSLEPENRMKNVPKERIIPIQVESERQVPQQCPLSPPPKPPMPQRSMSQRSGSLSRQSTADSDTDSAIGSTIGAEPIRKSPREYIIPIAVEGGGYVTPRSGSLEPESKTSTPTSTNPPRSRFGLPRRMSSLLSDASEDESPFSTLHRDNDDLLQRHMHRLRSSRPTRQAPEHADSLSSGEDDDDDGFELLTAENLFSTLLSRVRSLTQRLNVDDNRGTGFPSSRLLGRLGSNSPQGFWGMHEPLSRRLSESQFRRSLSRDIDGFGRKESTPGTPGSPGARSTPSRDSIFEMGSNTLPRDKSQHDNSDAEVTHIQKQAQETLEQNFTPSLARRLSRHFIEQTRQSLPRSPSMTREKGNYQSPTQKMMNLLDNSEVESHNNPGSTTSDQTEYRGRSTEKYIRRSHSLLEPRDKVDGFDRRSPRRSISLFDDDDQSLPPLPRHVMSLGRKYRDGMKSNSGTTRRDNFHNYKNDKIQEESWDDSSRTPNIKVEQASDSAEREASVSTDLNAESVRSSSNPSGGNKSSVSLKSCETSPNESTSNGFDFNYSYSNNSKSDSSKDFENRLLAAENLIKESKLKNLGPSSFDVNLTSSYRDTDKCNKESLAAISEGSTVERRRSYIPSLRMRSSSLTREPMESKGRRRSFTGSQDVLGPRAGTPERSILSKFFKSGSSKDAEGSKERQPKGSGQRRISRFLRPDFFDTPREESQYVKEKEAQKAAENERRKSRFSKKKSESKDSKTQDERPPKDLKNEANSLTKDQSENSSKEDKSDKEVAASSSEEAKPKFERQPMKNSFLHSLEKKLERFRMSDEVSKSSINNGNLIEQKIRSLRENSAPPEECLSTESGLIKRAVSVEDLSLNEANVSLSKAKVNSVLGLFKNNEPKSNAPSSRPQIFSKLRKSSYKGSRSDTTCDADAATTTGSKIPTKFTKLDSKLSKRKTKDSKTSDDASPPKEPVKDVAKKSPDRLPEAAKRVSPAKSSKASPEKTVDKKNESSDNEKTSKSTSTEKSTGETTTNGSGEKSTESSSGTNGKKMDLPRKSSVTTLRNGSAKKGEKVGESEKKVPKSGKSKDAVDKESGSGEGTKKKKIVRVVKKVVKKSSDSSGSKSEPKEKPLKTLTKRVISLSKEKSGDSGQVSNGIGKSQESNPKSKNSDNVVKLLSRPSKSSTSNNSANETSTEGDLPKSSESTSAENSSHTPESKLTSDSTSNNATNSGSDRSDLVADPKPAESRAPNRNSLKLDLSKIPQHTFRNSQSTRKDSVRLDTQKLESIDADIPKLSKNHAASKSPDDAKKLIQNLSKITYNPNVTGSNKIVVDGATESTELRKDCSEAADKEKLALESAAAAAAAAASVATTDAEEGKHSVSKMQEEEQASKKSLNLNLPVFDPNPIPPPKESPGDAADEMLSPMDDTESFDSWSICSADMNHSRSDLQSPTSPAYSPTSRGDQPESVVDRIRRRSFYSRFNDRKRKPSLNAPPPGVTLPASSTLPRKFSFNRTREKEHEKLSNFVSSPRRYPERSYSLYNDEVQPYRRSPIDRDRFSDTGIASSYSSDLRSPSDLYGSSLSSPYDPFRKYMRSPTFETSNIRRKYHSSDYGIDNDSTTSSYRSPLSSTSLLNDHHALESHSLRSFNTLPKKYVSTITNSEPKTAEYYEELLTPSNADYLSSRRTPTSSPGDASSCENGYHNGNLDTPHQCKKAEKWKNLTDKMAGLNSTDLNNGRLAEQMRDNSQDAEEPKELPSTTPESQPSTSAK